MKTTVSDCRCDEWETRGTYLNMVQVALGMGTKNSTSPAMGNGRRKHVSDIAL